MVSNNNNQLDSAIPRGGEKGGLMYSTYHVWKERAEKTRDELTENEEREVSVTAIIAFLALVAGVMLGYGWCLYHLGG